MFKRLETNSPILWSVIFIATLGFTGFSASLILANDSSAEPNNPTSTLASFTNSDFTSSADTTSEIVYIIDNAAGQTQKILANSFAENKLNETSVIEKTDLPITYHITYKLNDQEINGEDLIGQSGRVVIRYDFANNQHYGNYQVPFAAITTLVLNNNFSDVTVTNGRVLDDGSHKVILGLTLPGLNDNFSTNLDLPDYFEVAATVKDFSLASTYTLATNQIFSELNTSNLNSVDELATAMAQLSDSTNQLIAGSSQLQNGLQQLLDKSGELVNGVNQLNAGLQTLSSHSDEINSSLDQLASTATTLGNLSSQLSTPQVQTIIQQAAQAGLITQEQIAQALNMLSTATSQLSQVDQLVDGIKQYTAGVDQAATGSQQLADNLPALTDGITALRDGSIQLTDGLKLFNEQGIKQLVSTTNDITTLANDLRATINASRSYTHYSQPLAQRVSFIYKTNELAK